MQGNARTIILAAILAAAPGMLRAQFDFSLAGRQVQVHSFASQGFAYSNDNNYLTMKTSRGSFAFTDGGANISARITDKFRVGAQVYLRNIGNLGNWHLELDWAVADYKFADWFGVRGGKVKSTVGLFNDVQDLEFLHTWAILPQSLYPLDLRAMTISHKGGDLYGAIPLRRAGSLSYTAWGGLRSNDPQGGFVYGLKSYGNDIRTIDGYLYGADLRWNTPLPGLMAGASQVRAYKESRGFRRTGQQYLDTTPKDNTSAFYVSFSRNSLKVDGEYRREWLVVTLLNVPRPPINQDIRGWYASLAYRVSKRLELGTYHSRYYDNWRDDHGSPANHIFDQTVTARVDLSSHLGLKVEQHFIDGTGNPFSMRGFYTMDNPAGMQPTTRMFVIRLGFNL